MDFSRGRILGPGSAAGEKYWVSVHYIHLWCKARDNTLSEVTEIVIEGPKFVGVYIICRLNTIILEKLKNIRQYLRESSCFSSEQYKDNVDYTKVLVGTAHTEQKEKEKVVLL